jgi:hypothetical protein
MSHVSINKQKMNATSSLSDEVVLREISYLELGLDRVSERHGSRGIGRRVLAGAYIVFLYAISILAIIVAAVHET